MLPAIEQGTIIFIGSTTENPYAAMTPAIVSRCRVFEFKRLTKENIIGALKAALKSRHKGLGKQNIQADEDALEHIARVAGGDLRTAYNALELAALTSEPNGDGEVHITLADAEQSAKQRRQRAGRRDNDDLHSLDHLSLPVLRVCCHFMRRGRLWCEKGRAQSEKVKKNFRK